MDDNNKYLFDENFSFEDFIDFLKKAKFIYNYNNPVIIENFKKVFYEKYYNTKRCLKENSLVSDLHKNFPTNHASAKNIDGLMKRGFSKLEAELQVKKGSPLFKEYWTEKGFSEEEAIEKVSKEQSRRSALGNGKRRGVTKKEMIEKFGKEYADLWAKKKK